MLTDHLSLRSPMGQTCLHLPDGWLQSSLFSIDITRKAPIHPTTGETERMLRMR